MYEEVEPFTGARPVIICGVLANRIADSLTESYPGMYYQCKSGQFLCNKNSYTIHVTTVTVQNSWRELLV